MIELNNNTKKVDGAVKLFGIIIFLIGYFLLFYFDWRIGICAILIVWGNNCAFDIAKSGEK